MINPGSPNFEDAVSFMNLLLPSSKALKDATKSGHHDCRNASQLATAIHIHHFDQMLPRTEYIGCPPVCCKLATCCAIEPRLYGNAVLIHISRSKQHSQA